MSWYSGFKPYVPVAKRQAMAAKEIAKRKKGGQSVSPVQIEGRNIVSTFWGQAWCENLEKYSDFQNRLPRGQTYVRNGSVVDLKIETGKIKALVSGSELYEIKIDITKLPKENWIALKKRCVGKIDSLVELLQGKLSKTVMSFVTDRDQGLFPKPKEIRMSCSCPDYAGMCKHLAAVMYGVGNRLDTSPELLFVLRAVDHRELIEQSIPAAPIKRKGNAPTIAANDLGAIFDIDIDDEPVSLARTLPEKPKAKTKPLKTKAKIGPLSKAKPKPKPKIKSKTKK